MARSSEQGNHLSGSIIFEKFLDYLKIRLAGQEKLCSMKVIRSVFLHYLTFLRLY